MIFGQDSKLGNPLGLHLGLSRLVHEQSDAAATRVVADEEPLCSRHDSVFGDYAVHGPICTELCGVTRDQVSAVEMQQSSPVTTLIVLKRWHKSSFMGTRVPCSRLQVFNILCIVLDSIHLVPSTVPCGSVHYKIPAGHLRLYTCDTSEEPRTLRIRIISMHWRNKPTIAGMKKSGIEIAGIRTLPLNPVNLFEMKNTPTGD